MHAQPSTTDFGRPRASRVSIALLGLVILLALWYQIKLLYFVEWGDESETVVAARMLAAGMRLYADVFNHHGPLVFLSGYVLEKFGHFSIAAHRVPIAVLQWLAILAIYRSPLVRHNPDKHLFLAVTITAMISLLPGHSIFGHAYMYQVIAGLFVIIIAAQYTLPAITGSGTLSQSSVVLGSFLIASLPFLAITYLPAAGLLFVCSLKRAHLRLVLIGTLAALVFNLAFLVGIGSIKGYLAYHIYLNAKILPLYNEGQGIGALVKNMLSLISLNAPIEDFLSFLGLFIGFATFAGLEKGRLPWRTAVLITAVMTLSMRGLTYQGAAFWYPYIGLMELALAQFDLNPKQKPVWQLLIVFCLFRLVYPLVIDKAYFVQRQEHTVFGDLAQAITDKNDRVIAYSFQNFEYLAADRLPASGHFFYLPWQETYNQSPRFGIYHSACDDIKRSRPKLMYIDKWLVGNKYPWASYAGCVQGVLDADYRQLPGRPIFVRTDYYDRAVAFLAARH